MTADLLRPRRTCARRSTLALIALVALAACTPRQGDALDGVQPRP